LRLFSRPSSFGEYIVVASTAAWVEQRRSVIADALLSAAGDATRALLWRPSPDLLRLEGVPECGAPRLFTRGGPPDGTPLAAAWSSSSSSSEGDDASATAAAAAAASASSDAPSTASLPERVTVVEGGVRYIVALKTGQKTGFYCDQRDSRVRVREAAHGGARVLDLCCYSVREPAARMDDVCVRVRCVLSAHADACDDVVLLYARPLPCAPPCPAPSGRLCD
jgi:hypothetical protein